MNKEVDQAEGLEDFFKEWDDIKADPAYKISNIIYS